MENWTTIPLINLATVAAMMTVGWIFSVLRRNVTIVDSLWGLGFVLVAGVTFWTGNGFAGRSLLILILTAAWGLRLAGYLTWRNWGKPEDHRYGQWRENSGQPFWIVSLFKVFWLQAVFLMGHLPGTAESPAVISPIPVHGTGRHGNAGVGVRLFFRSGRRLATGPIQGRSG